MTRPESWQVTGTTLRILEQVQSLGFTVSVFRIPESLRKTVGAFVEMHAVDLKNGAQHIAKVEGDGEVAEYKAACALAEMIGIDLEG